MKSDYCICWWWWESITGGHSIKTACILEKMTRKTSPEFTLYFLTLYTWTSKSLPRALLDSRSVVETDCKIYSFFQSLLKLQSSFLVFFVSFILALVVSPTYSLWDSFISSSNIVIVLDLVPHKLPLSSHFLEDAYKLFDSLSSNTSPFPKLIYYNQWYLSLTIPWLDRPTLTQPRILGSWL